MEPRPVVTVSHCPLMVNIAAATAALDGGLASLTHWVGVSATIPAAATGDRVCCY